MKEHHHNTFLPVIETEHPFSRDWVASSMLVEAGTALFSACDTRELLSTLARKMAELADASSCRVSLLDRDDQYLTVHSSYARLKHTEDASAGQSFPIADLPWHRQALSTGQPVVLFYGDPKIVILPAEDHFLQHKSFGSSLLIPLIAAGRAMGVLTLSEAPRWQGSPFSSERIDLCRLLAAHGALALHSRQMIESARCESEQARQILADLPDGVFCTDRDGVIRVFNEAAEQITGLTAEQVLGRKCRDVMHGTTEDGSTMCEACTLVERAATTGHSALPVQWKEAILRPDGRRVTLALSVAPSLGVDGTCGNIVVLRSISHEDSLVRSKMDLVSFVSHELRSPLTNIGLAAELLSRPDLDKVTKEQTLETLTRYCGRLLRIANDILEASRLEQGRVQQVLEPLALTPLVRQTVAILQRQYSNYVLKIEAEESLPFAMGDLMSVEVVLENLIQNSIHYSPAGSSITISLREKGDSIEVQVRDQGQGIPPDQLERIFLRFHRVSNNDARHPNGFGLGLYIAKMLVEAQGGAIWAESEPGQGSSLYFSLRKVSTP